MRVEDVLVVWIELHRDMATNEVGEVFGPSRFGKYDEHGNEVELAYFGTDNKPTLHKNGYALVQSKFDERGKGIEKAYFGIDNKPTLHKNGYALVQSKFDERSNGVETCLIRS